MFEVKFHWQPHNYRPGAEACIAETNQADIGAGMVAVIWPRKKHYNAQPMILDELTAKKICFSDRAAAVEFTEQKFRVTMSLVWAEIQMERAGLLQAQIAAIAADMVAHGGPVELGIIRTCMCPNCSPAN